MIRTTCSPVQKGRVGSGPPMLMQSTIQSYLQLTIGGMSQQIRLQSRMDAMLEDPGKKRRDVRRMPCRIR